MTALKKTIEISKLIINFLGFLFDEGVNKDKIGKRLN
ncbi:hypothetical protein SAMN04488023_12727 [Pedobacter rhizosphaerae]|jgi:hypothetical protein|uniref:Uncharacterized protein n=1 Tax=Pedobacter rhizosphaerae TaxID=390241 RepID=A0A1H9U484_9SPHI|nr:hypothetical protein SAMN04488023_12727 [Pedobacter rhizosphaerae]